MFHIGEPEDESGLEDPNKDINESWYKVARELELEREELCNTTEYAVSLQHRRAEEAEQQRNELLIAQKCLRLEVQSYRREKEENDEFIRKYAVENREAVIAHEQRAQMQLEHSQNMAFHRAQQHVEHMVSELQARQSQELANASRNHVHITSEQSAQSSALIA